MLLLVITFGGCSTSKNTSTTRFWLGFKSKYNTYFNGHQAYLEGLKEKQESNRDNYINYLPLLITGNETSKNSGKGNFGIAITKCEKTIQLHSIRKKPELKSNHRLTPKEKAFRERTEFNPFLQNAWLLMGHAQMEQGNFIEASSTFSYITRLYKTQPEIRDQAEALQAVCYAELGWYYDTEQLLEKIRRDGIPKTARRYYNLAFADMYLHQYKWDQALPFLQEEVKAMPHGILKARGAFLLSQVYKTLNMKKEAYKILNKCLHQNPPYEMRFNAEISQTEVMPSGTNKQKLGKLKRMAKKINNKDYLDRVYYAIGNVYMAIPDTAKAIEAYETGGRLSSKSSVPKGMLMVALGDIYWNRQSFSDALRCYKQAVSMIKFEYARFELVRWRSKVLLKLAPQTDVIHLQDSMQALVKMNEKDRNVAIDRVIAIEKENLKKQKQAQQDSINKARAMGSGRVSATITNKKNVNAYATTNASTQKGTWYFYDQNALTQGAELFHKQWGNRINEDNWRLSNKKETSAEKFTSSDSSNSKENDNSANKTQSLTDSMYITNKHKKRGGDEENDSTSKLSRAYYIAQLPFTPQKLRLSNEKLKAALYQAGLVEKDEMDDYKLAHATLKRLYTDFPDFRPKDELLYNLFLLESHWGAKSDAKIFKQQLTDSFPKSEYTILITDPYYEEKARYGVQIEDSIYTTAYDAYRQNDYSTIEKNCKISDEKYPKGANRAKFLFLEAMTMLRKGDIRSFTTTLKNITKNYATDSISEIAKNLIKGIQQGRKPIGGSYDLSDLWTSRQSLSESREDSVLNDTLSPNRQTAYTFILTYSTDSIDEGKLLYNISHFNFTNFTIRNFDVQIIQEKPTSQLRIRGFVNYDEVHSYVQKLYNDSTFRKTMKDIQPIIISNHNLKLVGQKYSINDYLRFYNKYYLPSRIRRNINLDKEPGKFIWDEFEEVKTKDKNNDEEKNQPVDNGEWY